MNLLINLYLSREQICDRNWSSLDVVLKVVIKEMGFFVVVGSRKVEVEGDELLLELDVYFGLGEGGE